jgi:hypothetical protein
VHPWVDQSHAPILVINYPEPLPDEEFVKFVDLIEKWVFATTEKHAWVIRLVNFNPAQRKLMADSQNRRMSHEKKYNACLAFVAERPMLRGVLTAIFWFSPPPFPYEIFKDERSAVAWAKERMSGAAPARQGATAS